MVAVADFSNVSLDALCFQSYVMFWIPFLILIFLRLYQWLPPIQKQPPIRKQPLIQTREEVKVNVLFKKYVNELLTMCICFSGKRHRPASYQKDKRRRRKEGKERKKCSSEDNSQPRRLSLIYAGSELQDHRTLEHYRIPDNGIIRQVLRTKTNDADEFPPTELPPSPSPPPQEAIVVESQSTVVCCALETSEPVEPQEEIEEKVKEKEEEKKDQDEDDEEPLAKRKCVAKSE